MVSIQHTRIPFPFKTQTPKVSQPQLFCQPPNQKRSAGPQCLFPTLGKGVLFGCDGLISWISSWASPVSWGKIHISSCSGRRSQFCNVTTPPPLFLLTQLNRGMTLNYGRYSFFVEFRILVMFSSWFYQKNPLKSIWLLAQASGLWNKKKVGTEWVTLTPWSL